MDVPNRALPAPESVKELSETVAELTETPAHEEPKVEPKPKAELPKGTQTPERNMFAALEEERAKRKEAQATVNQLEQRIKELSSTPSNTDVFSDEGLALKKEIDGLKAELEDRKQAELLSKLTNQFPALADSMDDFIEYRMDYPSVPLEKVAKLFLNEKGLLGTERKGLETSSGGSRSPQSSSISTEDVARLRTTNFRKYEKLLREGKILAQDIR